MGGALLVCTCASVLAHLMEYWMACADMLLPLSSFSAHMMHLVFHVLLLPPPRLIANYDYEKTGGLNFDDFNCLVHEENDVVVDLRRRLEDLLRREGPSSRFPTAGGEA